MNTSEVLDIELNEIEHYAPRIHISAILCLRGRSVSFEEATDAKFIRLFDGDVLVAQLSAPSRVMTESDLRTNVEYDFYHDGLTMLEFLLLPSGGVSLALLGGLLWDRIVADMGDKWIM